MATVSYLHHVVVLFDSARRVHSELALTVLVADCSAAEVGIIQHALGEDVDVLCSADLSYDFVEQMRRYYSALEFCSALKILGLAHVLKTEPSCLFLDPDTWILDKLDRSVLDVTGEIVLSCHSFTPFPRDSERPDDLELCLTGHINGGVVFVRGRGGKNPALEWLVEKTRRLWFVAPSSGMYADQQWLSAVPYFFRERSCLIVDRGVNVAYWNLHERPLEKRVSDGAVSLKGGGSLKLFHFSGFVSPAGGRLTEHSNRRFDSQTESLVEELVESYENELSKAQFRLRALVGNLGFCDLPLHRRMRIAAKLFQEPAYLASRKRWSGYPKAALLAGLRWLRTIILRLNWRPGS